MILTVDDAAPIRRLIQYNLAHAGYDVREADSGKTAFALLGQIAPDLILLDIRMPGWDGFEFLEHLRQFPKCAKIPVIMLTALSTSTDIDHALRLGAVDYLVKPFDPTMLVAKVAGVLRGNAPAPKVKGNSRRQFNRGDLHLVALEAEPGGNGLDIGEGGMGFYTTRAFQVGQIIVIKAPALFQQVGLQAFTLRARVIHIRPMEKLMKRVGVAFIGLTDENRQAIRQYALRGERPPAVEFRTMSGGGGG